MCSDDARIDAEEGEEEDIFPFEAPQQDATLDELLRLNHERIQWLRQRQAEVFGGQRENVVAGSLYYRQQEERERQVRLQGAGIVPSEIPALRLRRSDCSGETVQPGGSEGAGADCQGNPQCGCRLERETVPVYCAYHASLAPC